MKPISILAASVVLGFSLSVAAHPLDGLSCLEVYKSAEITMEQRQKGTELPLMIKAAEGWEGALYLIDEAYRQSQLSLPENRARKTREFAEEQYSKCKDRQA